MVDSIQASVYGRQSAIETELNDHRAKLQEMESVVVKSVTNANRTVESELSRFEKIISAFEKYIDTQVSEVKAQNQSYLEESRAGRGESFTELLRKQEDMQGRVAALTSRLTKVEDDSRDRASTLREELKVVETAHSQQILELQTKQTVEITALQEKFQATFEKTAGRLREQLDQQASDHQKQITDTTLELNDRFQENNRDIEKYMTQQVTALQETLAQERLKMDTIQEGKNQAYTVEAEKRILNKVTTIIDENTKFKSEMYSKLDQQVNDTRKMYRETKEERMVFDTKLATRLAEVREWTTKLIEENYEDFSKLLEARIQESEGKVVALRAAKQEAAAEKLQAFDPNSSLRNEVLQLLEDDRKLKNMRFHEINKLIETNKSMQSELVAQQFESQKALVKAIISKEMAERQAADEELQAQLTRQIANYTNKLNSNADVLQQKIDDLESRTQRTAQANEIKLNDNLAQIEARIEEHTQLML